LCVPLPSDAADAVLPPGTRVTPGQPLLRETAGASHVPLAPVAGVVGGVTRVQLLGGRAGATAALEIDVDLAAPPPEPRPVDAPSSVAAPPDLPTLIDRLRECGVRANRACSPDLLAQLHEAVRRPIDTVLCSLMDAAGGSALSAVVLRTMGKELLAGLETIGRVTGASRAWLVADSNIINRASALVRKSGGGAAAARIKVVELENDYPQADPTLMLYALLGRKLRPGRLPTDVNTILLDGAAAGAVGRAALRGEPMLEVPIEVRDSAQSRSTVYTAAVGLPVRFLLDAAGVRGGGGAGGGVRGGGGGNHLTLRAGAALRDVRFAGGDAVVDGGGELSIDAGPPSPPINPDPCIRSGWCVEACPVRIHPAGLLEAAQDNDPEMAERYGLHACIECGICSYVCPSRLPLLPGIRELRRRNSATDGAPMDTD
jgi:electron transport complex protein RnfC